MENKPRKLGGTFVNCISIDRNYNNQQSICRTRMRTGSNCFMYAAARVSTWWTTGFILSVRVTS